MFASTSLTPRDEKIVSSAQAENSTQSARNIPDEPTRFTTFTAGLSDRAGASSVQGHTVPSGISRPQFGHIISNPPCIILS